MGQDKWLGGVASFDGKFVYGAPGSARRVLRVELATGKVDLIGPEYEGKFKWLRGAECPKDQCLYCLPSNADTVLRIDPSTQKVDTIGGPFPGDWKWHGGNVGTDGNIYGVPANAEQVLKIDTDTGKVSTFGGPFKGRQKWYGGLNGAKGDIYCIPQTATGVLKITPTTQMCKIIGDGLPEGGWKWHGGLCTEEGIIYGIPSNADVVLKIDTNTDEVSLIGGPSEIVSGRHRSDGKYKYLGGACGADNKVFLFPCDAERVLMIDTKTDECRQIGPRFLDTTMNKWQNGFLAKDGCVYGIPQRAPGILKISPPVHEGEDPVVSTLDCGEVNPLMRDKFEGAVMGGDGHIYCMPLRAKHVVKIVPAV